MADMETTPTKRKPVTAPKPVARFSYPNQDEKKLGLEERNSSARREQHEIAEVIGLKTDKDGAITIPTRNASASQLPPKPALLPKPQSPLKPCIRGRPQFPHHSNRGRLQPSTAQDHPIVKPKSILSPLKIKAPVAKLDEFDSLYEPVASPVRPSRSPKMKIFPEGPFKTSEVRPELPVKKRLLSSGTVTDKEVKDWDHIKKRSSSLGRTGITSILEERVKSLSLSRSLCPSEAFTWLQTHDVTPGTGVKVGPVPPPRRRKRSEGALNNCTDFTTIHPLSTPVYAQVNYEMKKNRREVASMPVAYSQREVETFEENTMPILTGKLLLAGNKIERNNFIQVDPIHTSVELLPSAISTANVNISEGDKEAKLVAEQGSPEPITECDVILEDKVEVQVDTDKVCLSADAVGATTVITQQCIEDNSDQASKITVCEDIIAENLIPRHSALHCIIGSILQVSQGTDAPSNEGSILQASQVTGANNQESTSATIEPRKSELYCLQQLPTEKQDIAVSVIHTSDVTEEIVTSDSIEHTAIYAEEHSPKDVDEVVQVQCEDVNYSSISSIYPNPRPISTAQVSEVPYLVSVEERTETMSEKAVYFEAASSPTGAVSKLNRDRPVKLWRRQSWSSSKDTTPSPDRESTRKQKHNSAQTAWCDDGELSNGALADSDTGSSDNTGRKSQEDMATGNGPYVRSKIGLWFDSFGKGSKRKERKIRANSSFYNDEKALATSSSTGSKSPLPDTTEVRTSRVVLLRPDSSVGVVRSPSRVSSILDDMEPPEPWDSESDNEEHVNQDHSLPSDEQRKERKAFFIARELMTSECQFVGVLRLLNFDFIQAVHPVIPDHELAKISNGWPQLYELNKLLLEDLEKRIRNWKSNPKIADVIVRMGPFLKLYSSYIKNFETQYNYFDECCQKYPRFGKVVTAFEASPICKKLQVKHFMLKPVQRIPQYRMLLEDYQRNLAPNSADFADTATALTIVREVADHANRTIELGDHLSKLIDLQSQMIDYEIIKPGRVFLKDGELFKLSRKVRHPRYFILLNDCLLYTTRQSTSFLRVNTELPLDGMKVCIPQVEDNLNEFNIISVTRSFTLSATSLAERQDWIEALDNAIKDHASRKLTFSATQAEAAVASEPLKLGHQAPVWIQDARVTMCQSCTTPFTVMFRRHHCRACGKVVCGHCSDNRAPLRYKHFQSQRVCDDCHQKIREEFDGPESKSIMQEVMHYGGFRTLNEAIEATKAMFKKSDSGAKKKILLQNKKEIPQRLKEVAANDSGSQMSGWLHRKSRRSWKRLWFVLKDQVLYVYRASEDVVALESMPILGYTVEPMTERHFQIYEGIDATLVFQLAHDGQLPLVFHADSPHLANRWMACMEEATKLH